MTAPAPAPVAVSWRGWLGVSWAFVGIVILLGSALYRLAPIAAEPLRAGTLGTIQWAILAAWVGAMAYAEGYKGFQRRFSPRFAARAMYLAGHPKLWHVLVAPLFCMGLFHARRRVMIVSWSVVVGVWTLVMLMRHVPQPWRGIVDAGVVVGLAWGLLATVIAIVQGLRGGPPAELADGPEAVP